MDFILLTFAFSLSFLQSCGQRPRSRSRKGDCQGPGNQHHGAEHQVRSSSAEFIISLLSSEVDDKNRFHFANLRIFSFFSPSFLQSSEQRPRSRCRSSDQESMGSSRHAQLGFVAGGRLKIISCHYLIARF